MVAVISFVIALVGIALQMVDAFPEHREARRTIASVGVGVFLGALIATLLSARYEITGNVDRQFALLYGLAAIGAFFGVVAVLVGDEARRTVAVSVAGVFGLGFLFTGIAIGMGASPGATRNELSTDEIVGVADRAVQRGQLDRALELLRQAQSETQRQSVHNALEKRITGLEQAQANSIAPSR